jgi:putative oxidoreductase
MVMQQKNANLAQLIIRIGAAGNLLIHGITRLSSGGVSGFDEYLGSLGFPPFTAWAITFFEIFSALSIIAGKWVTPLCLVFCLELAMGIILVHFKEGWFVVGGGSNGMEYSVLLIICFASTALAHAKRSLPHFFK